MYSDFRFIYSKIINIFFLILIIFLLSFILHWRIIHILFYLIFHGKKNFYFSCIKCVCIVIVIRICTEAITGIFFLLMGPIKPYQTHIDIKNSINIF